MRDDADEGGTGLSWREEESRGSSWRGTSGGRVGVPLTSGDGQPVAAGAVDLIPGLGLAKTAN